MKIKEYAIGNSPVTGVKFNAKSGDFFWTPSGNGLGCLFKIQGMELHPAGLHEIPEQRLKGIKMFWANHR